MNLGDIPPGWAVVIGAVAAALLAGVGGLVLWWLRQIDKRYDELQVTINEQKIRIVKLEGRDRASYLFIQRLIISHTKHAPGIPLPDPPTGWLED